MRAKNSKYFKVIRRAQYFRLTHTPSGDYIQLHLCDFLSYRSALECRNRILAAAPDWDWSNPGLFNEMGTDVFDKVWAAIYAVGKAA